jgi:inorganic triphosphatase YgiF
MVQRRSDTTDPLRQALETRTPSCEVELKLRLRAQDLPVLRERLDQLGPSHAAHIDNIYYDTPDLRLAGARAALRLRSIQRGRRRHWVQTLKTENREAALSVRGEWETPAPGGRFDAARLSQSPLAQLLGGAAGLATPRVAMTRQLAPVFRTVFDRTAWDLQAHGAHIEVVIDQGEIQACGRVEPILELELELRAGEPVALFDLALALAGAQTATRRRADLSLLPFGASKAARGVRLAQGREAVEPTPGLLKGQAERSSAGHAMFASGQSLAQAARQWLGQGLESLLANALGATQSEHPEFVHQARIALRLMRVGMDLLGPGFDLPSAQARALQAWAKEFGAVRDWDVLCGQLLPALHREAGKGAAARWERVQQAAARQQQRARERLRRRLEAPEFAELALRLLRWSASRPSDDGPRLAEFAQKALRQRRRRLAKAARSFAAATLARQHKIRLLAKNLRYAVETLRGAAPGALRESQLRLLGRFQDAAGCARDFALARVTLGRLTRSRSLRGQIADWTRARQREGQQKARQLAAKLQDG